MSDDRDTVVIGRNDAMAPPPSDAVIVSLPPKEKVTLQVVLSIILGLILVITLIGAIFGAVEKPTLANILVGCMTGVLALMTGGNRIAR